MKRVFAIAFLAVAVVAMVTISGCTLPFGGGNQSTPVPTVYGPVPSALPTSVPTPTPNPAISHSRPSNDIQIVTSPMDYKTVTGGRTRDGMQFESITLMVENAGTQTATNVVLSVTIVNENNLNTLVYQQFPVGTLARGDRKMMTFNTSTHEYTNFIKMTITAQWGDSSEYYSNVPFEHTYSNLVL